MHLSVFILSKMHSSIGCWVGKCKKRINVYTTFRNKNVSISCLIIFDSCHPLHHIFASFLYSFYINIDTNWYTKLGGIIITYTQYTRYIHISMYMKSTIKLRTMENDTWNRIIALLNMPVILPHWNAKQWLFNESCFKRIVSSVHNNMLMNSA